MNIKLTWKENKLASRPSDTELSQERIEYSATLNERSDHLVEAAIQACIEKSVSFLSENIVDDSRYFLLEWDIALSALTIVVTDDTKTNDSKYSVKCHMSALGDEISKTVPETKKHDKEQELSDFIKYFVKDYLTTCSAFMQFSLVAVFHNKTRERVELL
jgi:hypothetical protein